MRIICLKNNMYFSIFIRKNIRYTHKIKYIHKIEIIKNKL